MIMFALVWWCYPIVAACVAVPMAFFYWLETRKEAKADREAGPMPCLRHIGADGDGDVELWCWQIWGHKGPHDSPERVEWPVPAWLGSEERCFCGADHRPPVDVADEHLDLFGPQESDETLPVLPQRLSKVPEQGTAELTLCTWGEDGEGNGSACWKPEGHTGPHMIQDTDSSFDERD